MMSTEKMSQDMNLAALNLAEQIKKENPQTFYSDCSSQFY